AHCLRGSDVDNVILPIILGWNPEWFNPVIRTEFLAEFMLELIKNIDREIIVATGTALLRGLLATGDSISAEGVLFTVEYHTAESWDESVQMRQLLQDGFKHDADPKVLVDLVSRRQVKTSEAFMNTVVLPILKRSIK